MSNIKEILDSLKIHGKTSLMKVQYQKTKKNGDIKTLSRVQLSTGENIGKTDSKKGSCCGKILTTLLVTKGGLTVINFVLLSSSL